MPIAYSSSPIGNILCIKDGLHGTRTIGNRRSAAFFPGPSPANIVNNNNKLLHISRSKTFSRASMNEKTNASFLSESSTNNYQDPLVSIIIPVFNEIGSIAILLEKVGNVMRASGRPYEIICVDDGSTDGCTEMLKAMASERDDLHVVIFRRNFGQTAAMSAGFDYAVGDVFITMDADLQNDPADIPLLLNRLLYSEGLDQIKPGLKLPGQRRSGGYDLVCGWRRNRKDDAISRKLPSQIANWLIGQVTGVKLNDYGCTLKAFRSSLIRNIRLYGEMHRFIPAVASMEGASIAEVEVNHFPRRLGKSKYNLSRIPRVLLDLFTISFLSKFRDKPMHFMGAMALLCLFASFLFSAYFFVSLSSSIGTYGLAMAVSNAMAPFMAAIELCILGFQLLCLGLLSEICVRTYYESQPRPVYRVREVAASPP